MGDLVLSTLCALSVGAPAFLVLQINQQFAHPNAFRRRRRELRRLFVMLTVSLLPTWYLAYVFAV